jgi:hypothetical protein
MVSFLLAFPQISYMHLSFPPSCYMPAHLILLDLIIRMILGEEYNLWSSSLCSFLHLPVTSGSTGLIYHILVSAEGIIYSGATDLLLKFQSGIRFLPSVSAGGCEDSRAQAGMSQIEEDCFVSSQKQTFLIILTYYHLHTMYTKIEISSVYSSSTAVDRLLVP